MLHTKTCTGTYTHTHTHTHTHAQRNGENKKDQRSMVSVLEKGRETEEGLNPLSQLLLKLTNLAKHNGLTQSLPPNPNINAD